VDPDPDLYTVPAGTGQYQITEKRSRFVGFAKHASTPDVAVAFLEHIRAQYHDASHHCFAWKIGAEERYSDAGEPTGTAGRPIFDAIRGSELAQTGVVVVRYFGGVKLGPGGLKRAYGEAARGALIEAGSETRYRTRLISVVFDHSDTSPIHHIAQRHGARSLNSEYEDRATIRYELRASRVDVFSTDITEATQGRAAVLPYSGDPQ
jgi:uncharacterized YigZ family protein